MGFNVKFAELTVRNPIRYFENNSHTKLIELSFGSAPVVSGNIGADCSAPRTKVPICCGKADFSAPRAKVPACCE